MYIIKKQITVYSKIMDLSFFLVLNDIYLILNFVLIKNYLPIIYNILFFLVLRVTGY